jgi:hypothetical protein
MSKAASGCLENLEDSTKIYVENKVNHDLALKTACVDNKSTTIYVKNQT